MLHVLCRWRGEKWLSRVMPAPQRRLDLGLLFSKHKFTMAAAEAGIPVPKWSPATTWEEPVGGRGGVRLSDDAQEAGWFCRLGCKDGKQPRICARPTINLAGGELMGGEFIAGSLGLTETLFHQGRPIARISSYKTQCWPTPLSASCIRQMTDLPQILEMLRRNHRIRWLCRNRLDLQRV